MKIFWKSAENTRTTSVRKIQNQKMSPSVTVDESWKVSKDANGNTPYKYIFLH